MADIVAEIRAYPLADTAGSFAAWGPDPVAYASALAASFPAGSKLYYYTGADVANPDSYNTTSSDLYRPYASGVAGGVKAECDKVTSSNATQFLVSGAITLEQLVAGASGTPCVYGLPASNYGEAVNEWWSNTTINIGDVADPYVSSTGYHRSGVKNLRASFASDHVARYWLCLRRSSDGSARNCVAAGSGGYSIETLGDGRVLRLSGQPAIAASLSYTRLMVERGGKVWFGFRNKLTTTHQLRLNLAATTALFNALGMPAPRSAATLTPDSLLRQYTPYNGAVFGGGAGTFNRSALAFMPNDNSGLVGAWSLAAADPQAQTFFFFADGTYVMADPQGDTAASHCGGPGYERGSYTFDAAGKQFNGVASSIDTNGCAGLHDTTALADNNGFGASRTLTLAADGKTASVVNSQGDSFTFVRLTK